MRWRDSRESETLTRPPPCADRPDGDQRLAVDDMIMVIEIHRRVAVRDGERPRIAGGEVVADAGGDERGMFVAHEGEEGVFGRAAPDDRGAAGGRQRLVARVDRDESRMIGADDARVDPERGFERDRSVAGEVAVEILLPA